MIDMGAWPPSDEEAADDGRAGLRDQALLPAVDRRARTPGPSAAAHRRSRRLLLRPATLPPVLQRHGSAIRRSGRHLQDAAARLPLRHHVRTAPGRGRAFAHGLPLVPGLRHRRIDAGSQRALEGAGALGSSVFEEFFRQSIELCRQAGLLGGGPGYVGSTLMRANPSVASLTRRADVARPPLSVAEYLRRLDEEDVEAPPPDEEPPAGGP